METGISITCSININTQHLTSDINMEIKLIVPFTRVDVEI